MPTLLFILGLSLCAPARADACRGCNVVLVSLDTVGARHLGLYGAPAGVSPRLDELGAAALVYENAYAPSPWTLPSHAAMLTGHHPWSMGIEGPAPIPERVPTLAQLLAAAGYQTAAFVNASHLSSRYGFSRGFADFKLRPDGIFKRTGEETLRDGGSWLDARRSTAPFFLFLHLSDAHEPHDPDSGALRAVGAGAVADPDLDLAEIVAINGRATPPSAGEVARATALYRAEIHRLDALLGAFLRDLERRDLLRNTLLVVTSDHGQELGEHGSLALHGFQLYDEVLRVPLVFLAPRQAAKRLRSPVTLADVAPAVLASLGLPAPAAMQGRALPRVDTPATLDRPAFAASRYRKPDILGVYARLTGGRALAPGHEDRRPDARKLAAIGKDRKLILSAGGMELYDLEKDPREREDIGSSCADEACRLLRALALRGGRE